MANTEGKINFRYYYYSEDGTGPYSCKTYSFDQYYQIPTLSNISNYKCIYQSNIEKTYHLNRNYNLTSLPQIWSTDGLSYPACTNHETMTIGNDHLNYKNYLCSYYDVSANHGNKATDIEYQYTDVQNMCNGHKLITTDAQNVDFPTIKKGKIVSPADTFNSLVDILKEQIDKKLESDKYRKIFKDNCIDRNKNKNKQETLYNTIFKDILNIKAPHSNVFNTINYSEELKKFLNALSNLQPKDTYTYPKETGNKIKTKLNTYDNEPDLSPKLDSREVNVNTVIEQRPYVSKYNINQIVKELKTEINDCICYSDCNGYSVCWCYGNCSHY